MQSGVGSSRKGTRSRGGGKRASPDPKCQPCGQEGGGSEVTGIAPEDGDGPGARMHKGSLGPGQGGGGKQRRGLVWDRAGGQLLGDLEQEEDAAPVALPTPLVDPVSGRSEAAGATFRTRPGSASRCRCCLLRYSCLARLAARRCRVGPTQPSSAPGAGIPTCRESPQPRSGVPLPRPSAPFAGPFFGHLPRKVSATLSLRSPQAPGPGASELPADASGQPSSADCAAGRCSGVVASAEDEPGRADAEGLFAEPPPG